jgi:ribose/xylose/arabinose/galactoside ABC-type transport system permease subunit
MKFKNFFFRSVSITGVPIFGLLIFIVALFQFVVPIFNATVGDYITNLVPVLLLTVGAAIVIIGGSIDLSIGTVCGLSAGITMWTLASGLPTALSILLGVATGTFFGLLNGFLITKFGINDFIATLATLNISGGLLIVLSQATELYGAESEFFTSLVYGSFFGIPTSFFIAGAIILLMQFLLLKTILGRRIFAMGNSGAAANVAGINVRNVKLATFVLSGTLAGCAGVLLASRLGGVQAFLGLGYEFTAIAGAVVGGVSLAGGRGSAAAALAGGLFIGTLAQGLQLIGIEPIFFGIVSGLALIIGVIFDQKIQDIGQLRSRFDSRVLAQPPRKEGDHG